MNFTGVEAELRAIFIMEFMVPDGYILLQPQKRRVQRIRDIFR